MKGLQERAAGAALVVTSLLFLAACAVPLGPGYAVERQQIELRYVAAPGPQLAVRAYYRLRNTGNQPLTLLEVRLPDERAWGRQNLRIHLDGRDISSHVAPAPPSEKLRFAVDPPWPLKQKREVVIAYELAGGVGPDGTLVLGKDAFAVGKHGWYPVLQAPQGAFASGGGRPDSVELSIRVPQDFLALSSGRATGSTKGRAEMEYRFRLRAEDSDPFVVAGRYHEQRFPKHHASAVFWTFQPLPRDEVRRAGERIAATVKSYETAFGQRAKKSQPVWVVQGRSGGEIALPDVAVYGDAGTMNDAFFHSVDLQLASTWFRHLTTPQPGSLYLADALEHYAALLAAEERGAGEQRQQTITALLLGYEENRTRVKGKSLLSIGAMDSPEHRDLSSIWGRLFLFALEDRCGKENLRRALARLIRARRGTDWAVEDLRSALEAETRQDLAEFFRIWLNRPGIPDDFRTRYQDERDVKK